MRSFLNDNNSIDNDNSYVIKHIYGDSVTFDSIWSSPFSHFSRLIGSSSLFQLNSPSSVTPHTTFKVSYCKYLILEVIFYWFNELFSSIPHYYKIGP